MIEALIFAIKVSLIQAVFFAFYWLVLRIRTSHSLNRMYLLTALILSLIIPFIQIPFPDQVEPVMDFAMAQWIGEPIEVEKVASSMEVTDSGIPIWTILVSLYVGVMSLFMGRSFLHLYLLNNLKKRSDYVKKQWFKLFKTTQSRPFSFFSNVFIPSHLFGSQSFDQILAHECVHVRQLHSLDRLLLDFLVSLFWFNPFIYLYRNALIEVHEFQADAEVVKQYDDLVGYQEILFAQLQPLSHSGLVSHFNFSIIKKRIVMMNKSKSKGQSRLAYLLAIPVVATVLLAFTSKESETSVTEITDRIEQFVKPSDKAGSALGSTEITQKNLNIPSILPLETDARFRMSSAYGMREHPVSKIKKKHNGMDFAIGIGAKILATADGKVEAVEINESGFGKLVVLSHGASYKTRYAQLSAFKVSVGDEVKKGQVIALSGNSGRSTGPHLHYEILKNGEYVDPKNFIKNYKFSAVSKKPNIDKRSDNKRLKQKELDKQARKLAAKQAELAEKNRLKAEEEALVAENKKEQAKIKELEARKLEELASARAKESSK